MRKWVTGGLALALICCGVAVAGVTAMFGASAVSTVDEVDLTRPLAVPPLAPSRLDERGPVLYHEDGGMMSQFVVEPGHRPAVGTGHDHGD